MGSRGGKDAVGGALTYDELNDRCEECGAIPW
jgi:hypothetical protein